MPTHDVSPGDRLANDVAGSLPETAELIDTTQELRDYFGRREPEIARAGASSFDAVHRRLMGEITSSHPDREKARRSDRWPLSRHRLAWGPRYRQGMLAGAALSLFCVVGATLWSGGRSMDDEWDILLADYRIGTRERRAGAIEGQEEFVARRLSELSGSPVTLPNSQNLGLELVRGRVQDHPGLTAPWAKAHYRREDARLALYQLRAPEIGMSGLQRTEVEGRAFFFAQRGTEHLIVWRWSESIVLLVLPDSIEAPLELARAIRAEQEAAPVL